MQPLPPSRREVGAEGTRKENAKLQENARNITSALDKNTRSPSPPTAELPPGGSLLNKPDSPINQNLKKSALYFYFLAFSIQMCYNKPKIIQTE